MRKGYEGLMVALCMLFTAWAWSPSSSSYFEEDTMAKVGRFVTDPRAGAYCQITLDSGEKLMVNHEKGGFTGGMLTIEVVKFMGLSSNRFFTCDLDSKGGRAVLAQLTWDVRQDSVEATPLAAFVEYVKGCGSVAEVKAKCAALGASR
jgi:hypothetical protein